MAFGGQRLSSLIFLILALSLFLFSAVRPDNLQGLRTGTADLMAPLLSLVNKPMQVSADYVRAITGLATLQEENALLMQENARLREWYQTALILKSENETLQNLLHITLPEQSKFVTARIIADSGNTYMRTFMVLAGEQSGVEKGHAVLAGEGLIGRIVEAGQKASRILLITDINSRVPVLIEGGAERAILAGTNSGLPSLIHLPPDVEVKEGARVITSGHGGYFPYGLPVGETVRLDSGEWGVRPFSDFNRVVYVRIVDGDADQHLLPGPDSQKE